MKTHCTVSSSRRKCRKAHFQAPSHIRRKLMSSHLSKELRLQHKVRAMPIRKDDEIVITKGKDKGKKGKVLKVYRKRWCIHVEKVTKDKASGQPIQIPIKPANCIITTLKLDNQRKELLKKKASGRTRTAVKEEVTKMGTID